MRARPHWASAALVLVVVAAAGLFLTGRLEFHWRPDGNAVAVRNQAGKEAHGENDKHAEKGEHDGDSRVRGDKVILDAESVKASAIRTAPAQRGAVGVSIQVTGEVRVPDERVANVTARVAGVVREIYKARGAAVSAGEPLATVESADFAETRSNYEVALADLAVAERNIRAWEARRRQNFAPDSQNPGELGWVELDQAIAEHASAVTERSLAERNLARMKELQDKGLRSRTELLAAEADHQRAVSRAEATARRLTVLGTVAEVELKRARQRAATARSKMAAAGGEPSDASRAETTNRFVIRSPIAGVVADREITLGETVEPAKKVFAIADLSEVWITAALYDKDLAAVRQGMNAVIRVQGVPDGSFKGRVVQIGPQVDEKTRTLPVRVAVNQNALRADSATRCGPACSRRSTSRRRASPTSSWSRWRPFRRSTASPSSSWRRRSPRAPPSSAGRRARGTRRRRRRGHGRAPGRRARGDGQCLPAQERVRAGEDQPWRCALRAWGAPMLSRFLAFVVEQRLHGAGADRHARRRRRLVGPAPAHRRRARRHQRAGADQHECAGAVAARGRASDHPADRDRDGGAARRRGGAVPLEVRPLAGDGGLRGRRQHLLRAPARPGAPPGGPRADPARSRHAGDGTDLDAASGEVFQYGIEAPRATSSSSGPSRTGW